MHMDNKDLENVRKRLVFQSNHRGCKEMDMVLGQFCELYVPNMSLEDIKVYERLLEEDDWDMWGWLNGRGEPTSADYLPLLEKMREYTPLTERQVAQ